MTYYTVLLLKKKAEMQKQDVNNQVYPMVQ